jgi:hypothetical protein
MIDKNWIEEEFTCTKKIKLNKKTELKMENDTMFRLLFLVLGSSFLFWTSLSADCISCPKCYHEIDTESQGLYIFYDTWICPNPHCGYENYDEINYCGICGSKKP